MDLETEGKANEGKKKRTFTVQVKRAFSSFGHDADYWGHWEDADCNSDCCMMDRNCFLTIRLHCQF